MKLAFLDRYLKNSQISYFKKIRPVEAKLYHVDRRTFKMKLIAAFHNFANVPKKPSSFGLLPTTLSGKVFL
jgi:hypothetical protein